MGSQLIKGAAVLGAAAVISKLLGTLQKIPLQNVAGDQTYGIYSAVYPYYILILFVATAGFPVAVSKFVSERVAQGDHAGAGRVLYVSAVILTLTGLVGFCFLYFGAGWIAQLIANSETEPAIRSVSFALLLVPLMSALRGHFQGYQNMLPTGISQVTEQFVRVGTMLLLLIYFVSANASERVIAAGQMFGSVTGAAAGLVVMLVYWGKHRRAWKRKTEAAQEAFIPLAGKILLYALPVCLGAIVVPILNIVDTFTMPRLLKDQGFDEAEAMRWFGIYARGLTLVQLVSMIASSMSVALIPAIAAAKIHRQHKSIQRRSELTMRLAWMVGIAASVGIALTALPVNIMLYRNASGTTTMIILGFTAVFSMLNIISASILQGMGSVIVPAVNLCLAAVIKLILNLALMPLWGIDGAAISAVIAFAAACLLNLLALYQQTGIRFTSRRYLYKPGVALVAMSLCLLLLVRGLHAVLHALWPLWSDRVIYTPVALISICVGAVVYLFVLFRIGAISAEDLTISPQVGAKWLPRLIRWRLVRGSENHG